MFRDIRHPLLHHIPLTLSLSPSLQVVHDIASILVLANVSNACFSSHLFFPSPSHAKAHPHPLTISCGRHPELANLNFVDRRDLIWCPSRNSFRARVFCEGVHHFQPVVRGNAPHPPPHGLRRSVSGMHGGQARCLSLLFEYKGQACLRVASIYPS